MEYNQSPDEIRKIAMDLDNAIASQNIELLLSTFCDDCEIKLLGIKLAGKEGARKWLDWMYEHLAKVELSPVMVMVDGNTLFEEFILKATLHNGIEIESKQAEVLTFENDKIKSLRLYFDRMDFADSVVKGFLGKALVNQMVKTSLKGLI